MKSLKFVKVIFVLFFIFFISACSSSGKINIQQAKSEVIVTGKTVSLSVEPEVENVKAIHKRLRPVSGKDYWEIGGGWPIQGCGLHARASGL